MIQADHFYVGVSVALGLLCLVSIFLAGKYVPDKGTKNLLIVSLVLFAISGTTLAFCQHILRMSSVAYIGDLVGATDGRAFEQVSMFGSIAAAANIVEVLAVALCVLVVKKMISLRAGAQSEMGAE